MKILRNNLKWKSRKWCFFKLSGQRSHLFCNIHPIWHELLCFPKFFLYVREKIVDYHPVLWIPLFWIRLVTKSGTSSSHTATLLKYWACLASAGVHYFPAYGWKSSSSSTLPPHALSITYRILDKHLPLSFNSASTVI